MVDIAVSAARRAMVNNLDRRGWRRLGSLVVHTPVKQNEVIRSGDPIGVKNGA